MRTCSIENCDNKHLGNGYCIKHYMQIKQNGKILERTKYDPNEIIDCGDYYELCIYEHNPNAKEIARAKFDKDDLEKVKQYKWCLSLGYIINAKTYLKLHQLVLGKKSEIDHINHDILDNRKNNLRHCTHQENCMNRDVKGIYWHKKNKKWIARIMKNFKSINLGNFDNEEDALEARKVGELKYFGEYAYGFEREYSRVAR